MGTRRGGDMTTTEYLDLIRILKALAADHRNDIERVLGMLKTPEDHRTRQMQWHFLKSIAGRRKGWADRAARLDRLLLDCERMALELE